MCIRDSYVLAELWMLASIPDIGNLALVSFWSHVSTHDESATAVWKKQDAPSLIDLEYIMCPVTWSYTTAAQSHVRIVLPFEHRARQAHYE